MRVDYWKRWESMENEENEENHWRPFGHIPGDPIKS